MGGHVLNVGPITLLLSHRNAFDGFARREKQVLVGFTYPEKFESRVVNCDAL